MKKLMIAAAIVCAAVVAQAASWNWEAQDSYIYDPIDDSGEYPPVAAGTAAYLAFVDGYALSDVVNDFAAGSVQNGKFASTSAVNDGGGVAISEDFTSAHEASVDAFFVILDGDYMFVSETVSAAYSNVGTSTISFPSQTDIADYDLNPFKDAAEGYAGAGWYTTSTTPEPTPTPEPTSGLLMLVGLAGLALRRRRA